MTERVREIKFEHFRGLPNYACKLSGKNLAVFGGNGKGKSAIVDGLEFLFSGRVARFPRRRKIAEYAGERILDEEATRRAPNPHLAHLRYRWLLESRWQSWRQRHALHQSLLRPKCIRAHNPRPRALLCAARHSCRRRNHDRLRTDVAPGFQALHLWGRKLSWNNKQAIGLSNLFQRR